MVQVAKDPIGTKGARLTTTISLAGHKLVLLPKEPHVGVSQRIEDEVERDRLKELILSVKTEDNNFGYIVRTCAEGATAEEFIADMKYLSRLWAQIEDIASRSPAPS